MAITRTQIVKQLLEKGGRVGLKNGPAGGASAGGKYGGNRNPEQTYGGGNTNRERGITQQYQGPKGTTGRIDRPGADPKPPQVMIGGQSFNLNPTTKQAQEKKNFAISIENDRRRREARKRALKERTFLEKLGKLGYTDRTLDTNLEDFGAINPQGITIGGVKVPSSINALSEFTVDPATKSFDIDSIRELASTKTTTGGSMSAKDADTLGDIREDIQMRSRIQDPNDNVSFDDFQEYMNRNKIENVGGDGIQDPCKGPNPPAYCFVGIRSAEAATPEKEEDEIINYRLMSKGGRAAFRGGDAARSDAASGRNAGRADPSGGVDDRSNAGQTAINNAAIMMARMQNNNLNQITNPNLIEKFPSGLRAIDNINLDRMIADMNLNNITDDDDTNAIDTGSPENVSLGTGLAEKAKQDIMNQKNTFEEALQTSLGYNMGGRAGLAGGGMPYEGGIMDLETSRQMYGLGKFVKKITRGVKKIAKSPIGKAAIVGGLGYLANSASGGAFSKFFKDSIFGKVTDLGISGANRSARTGGLLDFIKKNKMLTGLAGTTALSYFMTPEEEEEQKLYAGADIDDPSYIMNNPSLYTNRRLAAEGGSMDEPVAKKTMPLLDMDGKEMDLREEGGFVPLGRMEKADDVPARLSKNEFVFTADAVRNAGEGDVDKGAEVMYNMMKNLESGGDVSEESQGLEGARDMFQTSQRLEEVL